MIKRAVVVVCFTIFAAFTGVEGYYSYRDAAHSSARTEADLAKTAALVADSQRAVASLQELGDEAQAFLIARKLQAADPEHRCYSVKGEDSCLSVSYGGEKVELPYPSSQNTAKRYRSPNVGLVYLLRKKKCACDCKRKVSTK